MWSQNPDLRPDEEARVTQPDSAGWGHELKVGWIVKLLRFDSSDNSWQVLAEDEKGVTWETWISQDDLGPAFDPVTDEEVAALFGTTKEA